MKRIRLNTLSLYRFRYPVAYTIFAAIVAFVLLISIDRLPAGLHQTEMDSAVTSAQLSWHHLTGQGSVVDILYHAVQKVTIRYVGLNPIGIRLPSVIFGILTMTVVAMMLRRWFQANIAAMCGIIVATSVPILSLGRTGNPDIMIVLWTAALLWAATHVIHGTRWTAGWKVLTIVIGTLSLYTPMMAYPIIACLIAAASHPHTRYVLRHAGWIKLVLGGFTGLLLLVPLLWSLTHQPRQALTLLGLDHSWPDLPILRDEAIQLLHTVAGAGNLPLSYIATPWIGFAGLALIIFGILLAIREHHSARTYMLISWILLSIPAILFDPTNLIIYIVPGILLMAGGLDGLIREWYVLFPHNPYARVLALLPIALLLGSLSITDASRYFQSHLYNPALAAAYQPGLEELRATLDANGGKATVLTNTQQEAFYELLRPAYPDMHLVHAVPSLGQPGTFVAMATANTPEQLGAPQRIVTNDQRNNSVVLRVYNLSANLVQ